MEKKVMEIGKLTRAKKGVETKFGFYIHIAVYILSKKC